MVLHMGNDGVTLRMIENAHDVSGGSVEQCISERRQLEIHAGS
jgi:hypothetical protein